MRLLSAVSCLDRASRRLVLSPRRRRRDGPSLIYSRVAVYLLLCFVASPPGWPGVAGAAGRCYWMCQTSAGRTSLAPRNHRDSSRSEHSRAVSLRFESSRATLACSKLSCGFRAVPSCFAENRAVTSSQRCGLCCLLGVVVRCGGAICVLCWTPPYCSDINTVQTSTRECDTDGYA